MTLRRSLRRTSASVLAVGALLLASACAGDDLASEQALGHLLHEVWIEMLGFAGVEIHRRVLGLAHNADFEDISNETARAQCEAAALAFGRHIAVNRRHIQSLAEINALAAALNGARKSMLAGKA